MTTRCATIKAELTVFYSTDLNMYLVLPSRKEKVEIRATYI